MILKIDDCCTSVSLNQWVLGSSPRWCTKECLTRKCRAFFYCSFSRRHNLLYHWGYSNRAAARKCRKERHSAAFLSPRESPRWCTRKSRNTRCGFFVAPFPPGRLHASPTARIHLQRPFSISLQHTAISVLKIVSSA